jgi:membrane-bound metal-dependent hydrolase YbcI (DUF457 family)
VDPASHVLFGALAVTAARPRALRPLVLTAAATSLLPDIDALMVPWGWDRYLVVHEIGTHSLAGAALVAGLTAVLLHGRVAAGWPSTAAAALAGSLGHVFWDVVSGAEIRLFWPFGSARLGAHLIAMADPFVLAILACGAAGGLLWRGRAQPLAAATLLVLALFLSGKVLLQYGARAAYQSAARRAGDSVMVVMEDARWGSVTGWWVYDRTSDRLRTWQADGWKRDAALLFARAATRADERIRASHAAPAVQHAVALFDFAFAEVSPLTGGGHEVRWSDIRFCRAAGACGLWFGVRYAADGAPLQQIVRVGTLVQTREMPPRR